MTKTMLEHVNFTVPDAKASAQLMCDLFGWTVRWQGPAKGDGFTVHVGSDDAYLALYTPPAAPAADQPPPARRSHRPPRPARPRGEAPPSSLDTYWGQGEGE